MEGLKLTGGNSKMQLLHTSHYTELLLAQSATWGLHELWASAFFAKLHYGLRWNTVLLNAKRLSHLPMKHQGLLLCARGEGVAVASWFWTSSDPSLTSEDQQHSTPTRGLISPFHPSPLRSPASLPYGPLLWQEKQESGVRRAMVTCLKHCTVLRKSVCSCTQLLSTDTSLKSC